VCGLPINQFKANKDALEDLVMSKRVREINFNGEHEPRKIIITDFKVYPEAVGAYYSLNTNDDVIIVDIGGRTTDIAYIVDKKLMNSSTIVAGTLNIYKDIADRLNAAHGLDLDIPTVDRVMDRGYLEIDGTKADLSFITEILKKNFTKINDDLSMKFPSRTEKIILVGGGSKLFEKAFKKRYLNCYVADNPVFANAIGFKRVGEMLWA
jgi:plasmid segregation protein ParM